MAKQSVGLQKRLSEVLDGAEIPQEARGAYPPTGEPTTHHARQYIMALLKGMPRRRSRVSTWSRLTRCRQAAEQLRRQASEWAQEKRQLEEQLQQLRYHMSHAEQNGELLGAANERLKQQIRELKDANADLQDRAAEKNKLDSLLQEHRLQLRNRTEEIENLKRILALIRTLDSQALL